MTFLGLLGLIFIVLKLGGVIAWSWWFVLSPLFVVITFYLFLVAVIAIGTFKGKL
ncbi:MAG: hypothetical protein L0L52_04735 [Staphylococcus equorum]|nr:hypothetical protein [Atopostipes sp.]MDN6721527.1 hypothetical protein [Staphylococcus equorum]